MDNTRLLNLYFGLIIMEIVSLFFGLNFLHIISNILTAPLILFIYIKIVKLNYKWYFILLLFTLYLTDLFHLMVDLDINNLFCVYLNSIAYSVLILFTLKEMEFKKLKELDFIFYVSLILVLFLYAYILYVVNDILLEQEVENYLIFVVYALLMFFMCVLITVKYII